jgi:hypothetical protein
MILGLVAIASEQNEEPSGSEGSSPTGAVLPIREWTSAERERPLTRSAMLIEVTKRLILSTGVALGFIVLVFAVTVLSGNRFMVSWACFGCGLLGGFVSIQQRLRTLSDEELGLLSQSWFQIALIPIYGGLFALVLYVGFLSKIVDGPLFPQFTFRPFAEPSTTEDVVIFLSQTYPKSGPDLAKLLFWCFVAGFSERFVPQIIGGAESGQDGKKES